MTTAAPPVDRAFAKRRALTFFLVLAAAAALVVAFVLPFMRSDLAIKFPKWIPDVLGLHDQIRKWILEAAKIPVGDQHLLNIIVQLFRDKEFVVGTAIAVFSITFPAGKIIVCGVIVFGRGWLGDARERKFLRALELTAKWSMADVFIVGLIIVFFKAEGFHFRMVAAPGLYAFAGSAIVSAIAVAFAKKLLVADLRGVPISPTVAATNGH
ncbi:MAG: paraquat-inducible protein A [Deltaproteobacteria bacterium]|nr:paraquat-inducible protein A [Deltaproteobacteria bacterium]